MKIDSIITASESYESWLGHSIPIVAADLRLKHKHMAESPFMFLRATFYRWMQNWNVACAELSLAPKVLAVGDLHIENFGTWRDPDGRLIWGVNDFDEAFPTSYAIDIVRLASSFAVANDDALNAILNGYERGIKKGGSPFVLEEHHLWLRDLALSELREPSRFWQKLEQLPKAKSSALANARKELFKALPKTDSQPQLLARVAGLGSLGRPRFIALVENGGSYVCREAKTIVPSACLWAQGTSAKKASGKSYIEEILHKAHRVRDPFYGVSGKWLVRRLAPHCSKIDVSHLPKKRDDLALFESMGTEIANIHLGTRSAQSEIKRDLTAKRRKQIYACVERMTTLTLADWNEWRANWHPSGNTGP